MEPSPRTDPKPPEQERARRSQREITGAATLLLVAAAAAGFAQLFRTGSLMVLRAVSGRADATEAARRLPSLWVFGLVAGAVIVAAWVGHHVATRAGARLGLTALTAAARGEGQPPSFLATITRATGTWIASTAMVSVGRESAILETGGVLGATVGRRLGRFHGALTAAGVSAAFATAYHAPVASIVYAEEHLGIRKQPRVAAYTIVGAAVSQLLMMTVLESDPIFPRHTGGYASTAVLGAIAVVPAAVAARAFLGMRDRSALAAGDRLPATVRFVVLAIAVGAVVTVAPLAAGNGMEALRFAAGHPTVAVAVALVAGRLVATTAALASGVPGGAFSPTMATSAGAALLSFLAIESLGFPLPGDMWNGMLVGMIVGVTVGLQAPLTAAFVVPEMAGDLGLFPVAVLVALTAVMVDRVMVDRLIDMRRGRSSGGANVTLHDEDA